jgi:hypothetical protein
LVKEDGLDSVDDSDTEGGAGKLREGDKTGSLRKEGWAVGVFCLNGQETILEAKADTETRDDLETNDSSVGGVVGDGVE